MLKLSSSKRRQMSQSADSKRSMRTATAEILNHRELLMNLVRRELRSRFRRTFLGWGWSFVLPVMMTSIYALVLGTFLKATPEPGDPSGIDSFWIFLLAGIVPWTFFSSCVSASTGSIVNAGGLITRVWFPRELIPMSTLFANLLTMMIEMIVLVLAITIIAQVMLLQFIPVMVALVLFQGFFTMGVCFLLAAANVRFKDVEYLTTVFLLAYFYLTPVVYPESFIPDGSVFGSAVTWRDIALLNPLARFMQAYRNVLYDLRLPGLETMVWLVSWSLAVFLVGFHFFLRRADRFAEEM